MVARGLASAHVIVTTTAALDMDIMDTTVVVMASLASNERDMRAPEVVTTIGILSLRMNAVPIVDAHASLTIRSHVRVRIKDLLFLA